MSQATDVSLDPLPPRRPLRWPPLVERLAKLAPDPARLYLVGGMVRDALRQHPVHDLDLATLDDGLSIARQLADSLQGAYYPIDPERHTGRMVLREGESQIVVDIASLRGADLLADLRGRDFTINALAVRLDRPGEIIDPLGGQRDLLDDRLLRQCSPTSIADDPIRALRAVRQSLQLNLRIEATTREATRAAGPALLDKTGELLQPERARDEFFKLLALPRPAAGLRLLDALGLWRVIASARFSGSNALEERLAVVETLKSLIDVISPSRDDNTAADLTLGVAVMVLDRYRRQLQEHLSQTFADGRPRTALLLLAAAIQPGETSWESWGARLRLSNAETHILAALEQTNRFDLPDAVPLKDRTIYGYYRDISETGIDGVLLTLAEYLAAHRLPPDPEAWGRLLENVAAPLLEAFFRRHQQVIAPPPLLTGDDLKRELGLKPGPQLGRTLEQLREEQAAGEIRTQKQALRLAKRLNETVDSHS